MKSVTAFAPASVGNLTVGFDVLGMALPSPGDKVSATLNDLGEVRIVDIYGDQGKLPREAAKNTAGFAVQLLLKAMGSQQGIDLAITKGISLGSGMGSSAASAVAALYAANEILDKPFTKKELCGFSIEAEGIASGHPHGDNTIPSMMGGIVLMNYEDDLSIIELPVPEKLWCGVLDPDLQIFTKEARGVLPKSYSQSDMVTQIARMGTFVHSLYAEDYDLLVKGLRDLVAEPYRAKLLPHFELVKNAALAKGAISCGVSGSGPAIYMFALSRNEVESALNASQSVFMENGVNCAFHLGKVNQQGAQIL